MTHARYSTPLRSSFAVPVNTYYGAIVRQSIAMMRARPSLRYAILYLTVVPLAAVIMETFFLQPQTMEASWPVRPPAARERVAHTVFVEAFLPHDGKSMLDAFDDARQREDELNLIAENHGRWPPPDITDVATSKICPLSRHNGS